MASNWDNIGIKSGYGITPATTTERDAIINNAVNTWTIMGLTQEQIAFGIATMGVESSFNPYQPGTNSQSDYGLGQMTNDTWNRAVFTYNSNFGGTLDPTQSRTSVDAQISVMGAWIDKVWSMAQSVQSDPRINGHSLSEIAYGMWHEGFGTIGNVDGVNRFLSHPNGFNNYGVGGYFDLTYNLAYNELGVSGGGTGGGGAGGGGTGAYSPPGSSFPGCFPPGGGGIGSAEGLFDAAALLRWSSPVILDLDNDGVETTNVKDGAYFDHDGNGFAEQTGWVAHDDGLLVMDSNGNGIIENGKELFGNETLLNDGTKASNGFQALADLDSNADGKIDVNDTAWTQLKVWQDIDGDGISTTDELHTLDELGFQSLNTGYTEYPSVDVQGNDHRQQGSFTKTDGTTGIATDVWFQTDKTYTVADQWLDVSPEIAVLPDLRGYGNVYDLHQSIVRDTSGQLKALVDQFIVASDPNVRNSLIDQILFKWTGSDGIDPVSRGNEVDARKLAVLENFFGKLYTSITGARASLMLSESYHGLKEMFYAQLMSQSHLKDLYEKITYSWDETTQSLKGNLSAVITEIESQFSTNYNVGKQVLSEFTRTLGGLQALDMMNYQTLRNTFAFQNDELAWIVDSAGKNVIAGTAGNDSLSGGDNAGAITGNEGNDALLGNTGNDALYGGEGDDYLYGYAGNDILDGGVGNDYLQGDSGNDTYRFNLGSGQDIIDDYDATGGSMDTVEFGAGITKDDLEFIYSNGTLTVGIGDTTDSLTIDGWFSGDVYHRIEQFTFADRTILTSTEIEAMGYKVYGTSVGDYLFGHDGNDILEGGGGNDCMYGGTGSDSYIFNLGDGQDTISEYDLQGLDTDTVKFGNGITKNDLIISRHDSNLVIGIKGTSDSVRIENWYGGDQYKVDTLTFADGSIMSSNEIESTVVVRGTDGDDNIYGYEGSDTFEGGKGNDYISGSAGSDTYIFNFGDGQDIIDEYDGTGNDIDTIRIGATPLDLIFSESLGSLNVSINGTTDQVSVQSWTSGSAYQAEVFKASNGSILLNTQIDQLIQAMATFSANNGMTWSQAIQNKPAEVQTVLAQYWQPN